MRVDNAGGVLLEVEEHTGRNVLTYDRDVIVSVRTSLFVMEAERVTHFVNNDAFLKSDIRRKPVVTFKMEV